MQKRDSGAVNRDHAWWKRMHRPALIAGWVCVVILCGYVYIAIDRRLNQKFLALLVPVLVLLVTALIVVMVRRSRRRRRGEPVDE